MKAENSSKTLLIRAYRGRADVCRHLGNHKAGISDYQDAIAFCKKHLPVERTIAEMMISLASIYLVEKSDEARAENLIRSALNRVRKNRDAQVYVQALYNLGTIAKNRGRFDKALRNYEKSLQIFTTLKDKKGAALSLDNIGNIHKYQGNMEKALSYYKRARTVFKGLENAMGMAMVANSIGTIYQSRGHIDKALHCYRESLILFEQIGYQRGVGISAGNIGILYALSGDLSSSLEYFTRSYNISEAIADKVGLSFTSGNIGIIHFWNGNLENALAHFKRCLILSEELGDRRAKGTALGNIASIYLFRDRLADALDCCREYYSLSKTIKYPHGMGSALYKMSEILEEQGKLNEAKRALKGAKRIYEQTKSSLELSKLDALLARLLVKEGKHETAREVASRSLTLAQQCAIREFEVLALRALAAAILSNDPKRAERLLKQSVALSKQANHKLELAKSLYDHSHALFILGKVKRSLTTCKKAAHIFQQAKATRWIRKIKIHKKRIAQSNNKIEFDAKASCHKG